MESRSGEGWFLDLLPLLHLLVSNKQGILTTAFPWWEIS